MIDAAQESSSSRTMNDFIADRLLEAADLLATQQDNPFRVAAYRRAAESVKALDLDVESILNEGGVEALDRIPNVGKGIAASIAEMARTGRWAYLQRLRGSAEPEDLFCAIPGVGPKLAKRLHEELEVETLEQLEAALAQSKAPRGVGRRRAAMIKSGLDHLLARIRPARSKAQEEPPVEVLLDVDREYREKVARDLLPRIAPKRFNPRRRLGCQCCTRPGANGISRRFTRTLPEPMSLAVCGTGSSYIFMTTMAERRSAPL